MTAPPDSHNHEIFLARIVAEIQPNAQHRGPEALALDSELRALVSDFVRAEFPDGQLVLIHGSVAKGTIGRYSDIDVLVGLKCSKQLVRRISTYKGWQLDLVEVGVSRLEAMLRRSKVTGKDYVVGALAHGIPLLDTSGVLPKLRAAAAAVLADGPDRRPRSQIDPWRAHVTALVSQICRCQTGHERMVIGLEMYAPLMALALDADGAWAYRGKHLARHFEQVDSGMNERLQLAYRKLIENRADELVLLAREILAPFGGWLADGFCVITSLDP